MIVTTTNRVQPPAGTVLHVAGELDTFSADRLRDHLRRLGTPPSSAVVVDLSGVTFMSCTALRVLAEARTRLGSRLYVSGRSRVVTRLLAMTGLARTSRRTWKRRRASPADGRADDRWLRADLAARDDTSLSRGSPGRLLTAVHGCTDEDAGHMLTGAAESRRPCERTGGPADPCPPGGRPAAVRVGRRRHAGVADAPADEDDMNDLDGIGSEASVATGGAPGVRPA